MKKTGYVNKSELLQISQALARKAELCYKEKCNNNIYRNQMDEKVDEPGPQQVDDMWKEIFHDEQIPSLLNDEEISVVKESRDHSGVFNMFESELKNMVDHYFESLMWFTYNFDT